MIYLKNTTDKQTFYIIRNTSGSAVWDLTPLDVEYTENGEYSILPPSGYDGLSSVKVTVNVDSGGSYDEGYNDGIADQKAKLTSTTFTENGTFNREDGWNSVTVDVDTQTPYDNGFADGEEAQKAKLSSLNVTENGTYSREDGWNEVTVNVTTQDTVTVQDLINEGYARVVTGDYGNYIEILDTCPYAIHQVSDLEEVATNQKQLTEGTNNVIVWNQTLPAGWPQSTIANIYANNQLNFDPRGEMFWAINDVDTLNVTFSGGRYQASDYPWGSYHSEGIFAPRYNIPKEAEYAQKGWRNTPRNVNVTFTGNYSSVSQVSFTQMKTTENLTLNTQVYSCQDTTGMFEGCTGLKNLVINGEFHWDTWRLCHNVFDGCNSLTSIPYTTEWNRTDAGNIIYPRFDGVRGSANCRHLFNAPALESIGPVLNMNAISLEGCTADGQTQAALSDALFHCPVLTDVRIINLNNNDWDFTDENGFVYIPLMDVASAEYLLNNVADVTSQGGHTVTLPANGTISSTAIANAESKGWTVVLVSTSTNCPDWESIEWDCEQVDLSGINDDVAYTKSIMSQTSFANDDKLVYAPVTTASDGYQMYYKCWNLRYVPLIDTSNVTNMAYMFSQCISLKTVPLFNTLNVTNMQGMFSDCVSLESVPLFDTSNVTNMQGMFDCYGNIKLGTSNVYHNYLTTVPLFNTSKVTNMVAMFNSNTHLVSVPLFDTANVTSMASMFQYCYALQDVPQFDTSKVTSMASMFYKCQSLTSVPLLDTSSVTSMHSMFAGGCISLTSLPQFDTSNVTNFESWVAGATSLTSIPEIDTSSATNTYSMFNNCQSLTTIPELDFSSTTKVGPLVKSCYALTDVGGFKNLGNSFVSTSSSNHTLDMSDCTNLTATSVHNILDKLGTVNQSGTNAVTDAVVKFDSTTYALADSADIASATAKGWSVVSV